MSKNQQQIEKLLSLNLDLDNFYSIRICPNKIYLQGECTGLTKNKCESVGFKFIYDGEYLTSENNGIEITLTF